LYLRCPAQRCRRLELGSDIWTCGAREPPLAWLGVLEDRAGPAARRTCYQLRLWRGHLRCLRMPATLRLPADHDWGLGGGPGGHSGVPDHPRNPHSNETMFKHSAVISTVDVTPEWNHKHRRVVAGMDTVPSRICTVSRKTGHRHFLQHVTDHCYASDGAICRVCFAALSLRPEMRVWHSMESAGGVRASKRSASEAGPLMRISRLHASQARSRGRTAPG
jgi:hypothetical protein